MTFVVCRVSSEPQERREKRGVASDGFKINGGDVCVRKSWSFTWDV